MTPERIHQLKPRTSQSRMRVARLEQAPELEATHSNVHSNHRFGNIPIEPPAIAASTERQPNATGLPDQLKAGVENLSGLSLDNVRVHYNSDKPAKLQASAYAQGTDIHVAPGQEQHLAHEAWHVVQQLKGRVQPMMHIQGSAINDDRELEAEASAMGLKALHVAPKQATKVKGGEDRTQLANSHAKPAGTPPATAASQSVIQPFWELLADGTIVWKDSAPPPNYIKTERTKKGAPVFTAPAAAASKEKTDKDKEEAAKAALADKERARKLPARRRKDFTRAEKERLESIPEQLEREDRELLSPKSTHPANYGRGKAHLADTGLKTAGKAPITATEQQDQDSTRKGRGNRISSKAPVASGQEDKSQSYGGQKVTIKARKLERARLRGKSDAQHVQVRTTDEILQELTEGPAQSDTGKTRDALRGFARKDREFHHVVDFRSADDPEHYIPNRFLIRPDAPETHDSDSEAESDVEDEGSEEDEVEDRTPGSTPMVMAAMSSEATPTPGLVRRPPAPARLKSAPLASAPTGADPTEVKEKKRRRRKKKSSTAAKSDTSDK